MTKAVIQCDYCDQHFEASFDDDDVGGMPYETCFECGACLCHKCLSPRGCIACKAAEFDKEMSKALSAQAGKKGETK